MKHVPFALLTGGFLSLAAAVPANAAYLVLNNGAPYAEVVHANSAGSGTTLTTVTQPGGLIVYLSSPDGLDAGNGNGVAIITGDSGTNSGFSILTIDPLSPFSVMQFKIEDMGGRDAAATLAVRVNLVGGGFNLFSPYALPSNSKMDVFADVGEQIDSIVLSELRQQDGTSVLFKDVKQISFDPVPVVPEPAVWMTMIFGLGAIGVAMRRSAISLVSFS